MRLSIRWGMSLITLAAIAVGLYVVCAAQDKGKSDPHASGQVRLPPGASEVVFCDGCHKAGCPAPHPELVKLTWPANGAVRLGVAGEVTCGTCHPLGFRSRSSAFLARDEKGLCGPCHFGAHALSNAHSLPSSVHCEKCHTSTRMTLAHATPVMVHAMQPSTDTECLRCHYDGPITHPIGVPNTKKKAADLPLTPDGKIGCVTCHVGHDQQDKFGMLLRKDNRRGGLCLSCHDDL